MAQAFCHTLGGIVLAGTSLLVLLAAATVACSILLVRISSLLRMWTLLFLMAQHLFNTATDLIYSIQQLT